MIYDSTLQNLYANDGSFIKKVDCPLAGSHEHLSHFQQAFENTFCNSCAKTVTCIDALNDEQVMKLVEDDSDACIFATTAAMHLTILDNTGIRRKNIDHPVIHTIRGTEAIVAAQALPGDLVIVRARKKSAFGGTHYLLQKHLETGKIEAVSSRRWDAYDTEELETIVGWHNIRDDLPQPIAAYYIPPDITPNTWVFLEDVISHIGQVVSLEGRCGRIASSEAFWDGEKMNISEDDPRGMPVPIG